jgi:glycosyltransferase involved in cell wall biosynthesis
MNKYRPEVLIIGNYKADQLQSMDRYASLLVRIYQECGQVTVKRPQQVITRLPGIGTVVRKYLAYIDKLIIFPIMICFHSRKYDLIHIADHSNGFYSFCFPKRKCIVTCHDLLAVRGARGDRESACTASALGPILQRLIMAGLRNSQRLLFVSNTTRSDYELLGGGPKTQRKTVVLNPLNADFKSIVHDDELQTEELRMIPKTHFILMVGSGLPRKNRALALRLIERLGRSSSYSVVFAGAPLTAEEEAFASHHSLGDRIISIVRPSHRMLNYLYCRAHALIFPSLSEGFGWPLIEAQACNCPVIASTRTSIPEIAGSGALYAEPHDTEQFYRHVRSLEDLSTRTRMIEQGKSNLQRFSSGIISKAYLEFAFSS